MDTALEHKVIDLNVSRKGELIDQHFERTSQREDTPPFFSEIEFNLSGLCNRTCVFCPRVDPKVFPNVNKHISLELYEKIVKELQEMDYDGIMLYSAFGEPLLYKRVEVLIEMTKRHCPRARLEIVTNGDFVTPKKLRLLFGAGLDTLLISLYDGPEQLPHFQSMRDEAGLTERQVVLRPRWLPAEQHFGMTLTNRAGMVEIREAGVGHLTEPLKRRCFYPFFMAMVDYDGSVLLCTHDWGKRLIVGNLNRQSLRELWNSDLMRRVRLNLANADRKMPPCNACDVDGTLMGRRHFERWMAHYESQGFLREAVLSQFSGK